MKIIGIAGPSGAGKTRVAIELARLVDGCAVLGTDQYYRDLSHVSPEGRSLTNFDSPAALDWDLLGGQLAALRSGQPVSAPCYDFSRHVRTPDTRIIEPPRLLLLEGLFVLVKAPVRQHLDLSVFLEASENLCLKRRIARDTAIRGRSESTVREQWERFAVPMYRIHVRPTRNTADLVLDAARPPEKSAAKILRTAAHRWPEYRRLYSNL
ncbi:MAG: hypothetical protein OXN89_08360 [Bryobacterales bacterium]|nr:hypothetical protein [Bryobacterales bacterium]